MPVVSGEKALEKKLKKIVVAGGPRGKGRGGRNSSNKYTSLLPKTGMNLITDTNNAMLIPPRPPKVRKNIVRHFANKQIGIRLPSATSSSSSPSNVSTTTTSTVTTTAASTAEPQVFISPQSATESATSLPTIIETNSDEAIKEMTLNLEQNQAFIMELLTRSQPYHDHCYTTVFGKKPGIERLDSDEADKIEQDGDMDSEFKTENVPFDASKAVTVKLTDGKAAANHINVPVIRLQKIPTGDVCTSNATDCVEVKVEPQSTSPRSRCSSSSSDELESILSEQTETKPQPQSSEMMVMGINDVQHGPDGQGLYTQMY